MHHRALHLSFTNPSFSSALQLAASRAWSRCVRPANPRDVALRPHCRPHSTRLYPSPSLARATGNGSIPWRASVILNNQTSQDSQSARTRIKRPCSITNIDPNDLTEEEMTFVDPGRSDFGKTWQDHSLDGIMTSTTVCTDSLPIYNPSLLPPPRSKNSLHQNLLYVIHQRDPIPSLPALVDYHDMHMEFQSTRSYNLLIGLALRHASAGTAQWLLGSMQARGVAPNPETWKLHVRWLVSTGRWDQVLDLVRNFAPDNGVRCHPPGTKYCEPKCPRQDVPLPIWLELFPSARGRSQGHRTVSDGARSVGESFPLPLGPNVAAMQALHQQTLMEIKSIVPESLTGMPPRLVCHMIRILFQSGDKPNARLLAESYLANLPRVLPYRWARSCLEIIHLHLLHVSQPRALQQFYELRRVLFSLLKLHRGFRPTSSTLLLLLAPLRGAKRCGTIAWNVLQNFQSQFGLRVVDSRVRRRIIALARKEGRVDIVDRILSSQQSSLLAQRAWRLQTDVVGGREPSLYGRLCRAPQRKVFRRNGKEQRTWHLLRPRLLSRMIAKQRKK